VHVCIRPQNMDLSKFPKSASATPPLKETRLPDIYQTVSTARLPSTFLQIYIIMLAQFATVALLLSEAWGNPQKILGDNALSPFTTDFEQRVNKALERWHVPGISIAVVDGDHEWSAVSCSIYWEILSSSFRTSFRFAVT
jgi:hypothetical protein